MPKIFVFTGAVRATERFIFLTVQLIRVISTSMQYQKLPDQFKLPFLFHGDPVMAGTMNGIHCDRCVLDTGAPMTLLRVPVHISGSSQTGEETFFESDDVHHGKLQTF